MSEKRGWNDPQPHRGRKGVAQHDGPPVKTRCDRCGLFPAWRQTYEKELLCHDCRRSVSSAQTSSA